MPTEATPSSDNAVMLRWISGVDDRTLVIRRHRLAYPKQGYEKRTKDMRKEHILGWEFARPASPFSDIGADGVYMPRSCNLCRGKKSPAKECKCQRKAIQALGLDDNFVKLIAPPGWGKSFYIRYDIVRRAAANPNLKFVIAIPRLAIGRGFCREMMFDIGEFARLLARNNLCDDLADERGGVSPSKMARIRRWLSAPTTRSPSGRVLLVSHAALTLALKSRSGSKRLSGVHVYVDEAHHLSQNGCDADDGATEMGILVKQALDAGCGGLTLATATYFRNDRRMILPKEHESKFKTFFCSLDLHMKNNLQRLERVMFRTVVLRDGQDEWNVVKRLLGQRRVIVFLPKKNQTLAGGSSRRYARDMARRMSEMGIKVECFVGDQSLRRKKLRKFLGVDFATEDERDAYLRDLGAILTINMFDEGADWPQAELAIDLAPPSSVGRSVQRVGRLLRDEKEACEYVSIYPPLATNGERTRETVSDRQNMALAMMVSMDAQIAGVGSTRLRQRSYLDRVLPDTQDRHEVRLRAIELLAAVDRDSDSEVTSVRSSLLSILRDMSPNTGESTLLRAVTELLGHTILTASRIGGGNAGTNSIRRIIRTIGSAMDLARLRRLFDTVVKEGAGVFATAAPLTHREMRELRSHVWHILKEPFTPEMAERCARAYKRKYGKPPTTLSGAECLPKGWTWSAVNRMLGSLLRFLTEKGIAKEVFSEEMVERCAWAYKKKYGKSPRSRSGAKCLPEGWVWGTINARLKNGLLKFLTEKGIAKEEFSEEMAKRCIRAYKKKHGETPTSQAGDECLPDGWTWYAIEWQCRQLGLGGLRQFKVKMGISKEKFSEDGRAVC